MALTDVNLHTTKSLEDVYDIVEYELEDIQKKFFNFNELVFNHERKMLHQSIESSKTEDDKSNEDVAKGSETEPEEHEDELHDTRRKLDVEVVKNTELQQDVADLNAMIDLYVREAQKRDQLEEEWQETVTEKLREKIRNLEGELFSKVEEMQNLENVILELRGQLNKKDEDISAKDREIKKLKTLLGDCEKSELQNVQQDSKIYKEEREEEPVKDEDV